jgi:hypothetical protein
MALTKKIMHIRNFEDGVQTTIQISKTDSTLISLGQVREIINQLEKKNAKVMVRALNVEKWTTLKNFDDVFNSENFTDYYKNKVKNVAKFTNFSQLQVSILKDK